MLVEDEEAIRTLAGRVLRGRLHRAERETVEAIQLADEHQETSTCWRPIW